jgi:hypothetical protein
MVTRDDVVAELIALRTEFSRRIDALLVKLATKKPLYGTPGAVGGESPNDPLPVNEE